MEATVEYAIYARDNEQEDYEQISLYEPIEKMRRTLENVQKTHNDVLVKQRCVTVEYDSVIKWRNGHYLYNNLDD